MHLYLEFCPCSALHVSLLIVNSVQNITSSFSQKEKGNKTSCALSQHSQSNAQKSKTECSEIKLGLTQSVVESGNQIKSSTSNFV